MFNVSDLFSTEENYFSDNKTPKDPLSLTEQGVNYFANHPEHLIAGHKGYRPEWNAKWRAIPVELKEKVFLRASRTATATFCEFMDKDDTLVSCLKPRINLLNGEVEKKIRNACTGTATKIKFYDEFIKNPEFLKFELKLLFRSFDSMDRMRAPRNYSIVEEAEALKEEIKVYEGMVQKIVPPK